ncbi:MAG: zinc-dependent alcohol dehydrogenase family protein, partial [Myxococcota bacterium]
VLPAEGVARVPAHLSDVEASTLPCAALTAWSALFELGDVRPGQTVLLLGTGGVSLFGLQFSKLVGARAIVISSSDEKLARARALGADEVLNYRSTPHWGDRVRELSGDGVDHVLEVGGATTLPQSIRASRVGATLSLIGVLGGDTSPIALPALFMGQRRVQGVFVGHRAGFEAMCRAISAARLAPVVDDVVAFDDAPAAFERMKRSEHFGKLCIRVS